MSIESTPNLSLPILVNNQSGKEITHNEALVIIDALLNNGIIDKDLATPPESPNEGDAYIVATSGTDEWTDKDGQIAFYSNGWRFISQKEGLTIWVNDENLLYSYNGTSWVKCGGEGSIYTLDDLNDVTITSATQYDLLSHNGSNFVNTKNIQVDDLTVANLTGSKIVETNISKKLISINKNSAYNKNFGVISDTVCEGNDARLSDSRTPITHNLAGSEHNSDTLANLNAKISDATLIDTTDSRLSDSRACDNTFDNIATAKTNLALENVNNTSDLNKPISTATQSALDLKANDNAVAHLTGDENINGTKTFGSFPVTPSSAPTTDYQVANKKYVDDNSGNPFDQSLNTTDSPTFAQLNVDNLRLDENAISSTNANGNILLDPNGTGAVNINGTPATTQQRLSVVGNNGSVNGPHASFFVDTDLNYPVMHIFNYEHDNAKILFDAYWNAGYKSSDAGSNFGIEKTGDTFKIIYDSGVAQGGAVTFNDGITLDTSGNVEIPNGNLTLTVGGLTMAGTFKVDGGSGSALGYLDRGDTLDEAVFRYQTNGSNRWLVGMDNGGNDNFFWYNYSVGNTVMYMHYTDAYLHIARIPGTSSASGMNDIWRRASDGRLYIDTSSERYKKNIETLTDISWLYNLRPVTYLPIEITEEEEEGYPIQYGLIAEEVQQINKSFVTIDEEEKPNCVHYKRLVPVLIKALQDQKTLIENLTARIEALENV